MILNAVGLLMIEQELLYPGEERAIDPQRYAESVARFARAALEQVRRPAGSRCGRDRRSR